jgi:hypothetical protein
MSGRPRVLPSAGEGPHVPDELAVLLTVVVVTALMVGQIQRHVEGRQRPA